MDFEALWRALGQSLPDFVLVIDRDARILSINRTRHQPVEALLGKLVYEFLPPEEAAEARRLVDEAFQTGEPRRHEVRTLDPEGGTVWYEATIAPVLVQGQASWAVVLALDLSARRQAEERLRQSEERFRLAIEATNDGLWEWDLLQNSVSWSDRMYEMLRLAPGSVEINPAAIRALIHPDDLPRFEEAMRARLRSSVPSSIELRLRRGDGSYGHFLSRGKALRVEGKPVRMLGSVTDVTERRLQEEAVRQAQKMEAIGTLAGGIAHDFNNILTGILGNAELAGMTLDPAHPAQKHLADLLQAAERARHLVSQILTFSRQREHRRIVLNLEPVVREALRFLRATLPATIEIRMELQADGPAVLADPTQVHLVLMNLGANAAYAMRNGGGRLEVRQSLLEAGEAGPGSGQRPGRYVRLSVSDTGEGMDAATLERAFEPFFTTKPPGEGTGLGLAVVHGVLQAHEGAVTVSSRLGAGTCFHLDFPVAEAGLLEAEPQPAEPPRGQGQRILFVDDEPTITTLALHMFEHLGYAAEAFNDPVAALEAFRKAPRSYDLVMTDLTMPRQTGVALARELRRLNPKVRVLMMSGFASVGAEAEAQELQIDEWLVKPFSVQKLAESVQRALEAHKQAMSAEP
jgi:PAS domain S-box-containing protein